jgi:7-carboxy-7-deazaguanine synthase
MSEKEYLYSEIFDSIQGEGTYTGVHSLWLRFFLCNLQCNGFGQLDPKDPSTYDLPFKSFDISNISKVEDLPVWDKGCDSSYSWAKKYKHLMSQGTPAVLAKRIMDAGKSDTNPNGFFKHPISGQKSDMCFTGGEPLLLPSQEASIAILRYFEDVSNIPRSVTYETNGTINLTFDFVKFWKYKTDYELFFSISPKLFSVTGEKRGDAIIPEVISQYYKLSNRGHLKFVLGTHNNHWEEMEEVLQILRKYGINYPVYIMPVGAREEDQKDIAGEVAEMALNRGYNVSARMHVYLFGNAIGT